MEIITKKIINGVVIPLLPDNKEWKNRIEIKSETSNRLYVVAQNKKTNNWGCSCPGWIIHRKCKHLFALKNIINLIEIEFNNTKEIQ
jgi:hypothetical protein